LGEGCEEIEDLGLGVGGELRIGVEVHVGEMEADGFLVGVALGWGQGGGEVGDGAKARAAGQAGEKGGCGLGVGDGLGGWGGWGYWGR